MAIIVAVFSRGGGLALNEVVVVHRTLGGLMDMVWAHIAVCALKNVVVRGGASECEASSWSKISDVWLTTARQYAGARCDVINL